jgi:hypothetical protein
MYFKTKNIYCKKKSHFEVDIKWLKSILLEKKIVPIYCKVQIYSKITQTINKFDEIFNHILHMSLLSHFNSI